MQPHLLRILAINPGATTTRLGVFEAASGAGIVERATATLRHEDARLAAFDRIADQAPMRARCVEAFLEERHEEPGSFHAVVARGGLLPPLPGGTWRVEASMLDWLERLPRGEHASNLGAAIAAKLAARAGIPAFVVDPVSVDELAPISRVSGHPEIPRESLWHALNIRATARRHAAAVDRPLATLRLVVAHLGSGTSCAALDGGRAVDILNPADEGPFSPERCGGLPTGGLLKWMAREGLDPLDARRRLSREGGLYAWLGTRDLEEVERRVEAGEAKATLVFDAMALQIAKGIACLAASLSGDVDAVLLTGGMARSRCLVEAVAGRVAFVAPLRVYPGEGERLALAEGALRVLRGQEEARTIPL